MLQYIVTVSLEERVTRQQRHVIEREAGHGLRFNRPVDARQAAATISKLPGVVLVTITTVREDHFEIWRNGEKS